jgi:hypothetical protein
VDVVLKSFVRKCLMTLFSSSTNFSMVCILSVCLCISIYRLSHYLPYFVYCSVTLEPHSNTKCLKQLLIHKVFSAYQCILKTFLKAKFSCHTERRKTKSEESKVAIVAELADRGTQKIWSPFNLTLFYKILLLR